MDNEQRFIELETKIAHQDFLIEELNQVIYRQQKDMDVMETKLSALIKRFQDQLESAPEVGPGNEKPPHY